MIKISSAFGYLGIAALLVAYQMTLSNSAKAQDAESAKIAATVPIADLHMHDGFGLPRKKTKFGKPKKKLLETRVMWGGLGTRRDRNHWLATKTYYGDRYITWAGQGKFNDAYFKGGIAEMLNPDNRILVELYKQSEQDLKEGIIVGFGEIFINNRNSNLNHKLRRKGQVDAPGTRKFFDLVAKYDGFLAFHMEADGDSMEQVGQLLASNRKGRVVWNHCGTNSSASDVEELMDEHPNLFCELSYRYPPVNRKDSREIFYGDGIDSSWQELMEKHSDRFMVGTDAHSEDEFVESIRVIRKGLLPNLKPDTARKIAYQNAKRLFNLKDAPKQ